MTQVDQSWAAIFQRNWGGQLLGVQGQCITAPKMRFCSDLFLAKNWRSFDKQQYFCKSRRHHSVPLPHRQSLLRDPNNSITMGVRSCVTAKLPVLRPWFRNLILLNLAPASCYFIASLVGGLRCNASRLLRMCWSSRGLPRRFLAPFNASSEK